MAKVNFLVKKLVEKGLVKLNNVSVSPNKMKYLYIVTPRGLAEKSRLTVRFAARTWREYSETIDRLRASLARMSESGARKVIVLGSGEVADMILQASKDVEGLAVVALIDPGTAGEKRRGVPIVSGPTEIEFDGAVPCDESGSVPGEIATRLGIPEDKIWLV